MTEHHLDAVIVGAGFAGMGPAIQLQRLGHDNFVILEREDDLGGTWHVNRYPGLTCDVPVTTYSYWFEPYPYWSRMYAPGDEIKRYADHVVDKYNLRRYMRFNTTVEGARWDDEAGVWRIALADGETVTAQFLITATGFLSQPRPADIPGVDAFEGRVIHSTSWDHSYSFKGRRAAVIGTGSTAVQIVPELAKEVSELTVYQRTPIWVMPKPDREFSPAQQRMFAKWPFTQRMVRWYTDRYELLMVLSMWKFRYFKRLNAKAADISTNFRNVLVDDETVRRQLSPDYDYGCKRPTLSNSFYPTFNQPNVNLETRGIERVERDGIVTTDGDKRLIDTLVLATGFDVWDNNLPAIEVIGRDGRNLGKWWRENRFQAYQGMSVPYFPNFLTLAGPYAWVGLSWFNTVECQMRHMNRLLGELRRRGGRTFEVTERANARFFARMTKLLESSVFQLGDCATPRSYWVTGSQSPLFRPTSVGSAVREQNRFPFSDYTIV